jgi:hypothetical protein
VPLTEAMEGAYCEESLFTRGRRSGENVIYHVFVMNTLKSIRNWRNKVWRLHTVNRSSGIRYFVVLLPCRHFKASERDTDGHKADNIYRRHDCKAEN